MSKDKDKDSEAIEDLRMKAEALLSELIPSGLAEGLGALHEMFEGLKDVGFDKYEALWIIGYVMLSGRVTLSDVEA